MRLNVRKVLGGEVECEEGSAVGRYLYGENGVAGDLGEWDALENKPSPR